MKGLKGIVNSVLAFLLIHTLIFTHRANAEGAEPADLGIYYGWPSYVNGSAGDVTKAVNMLRPFEVLVLGDGLYEESHPDHLNTKEIMLQLAREDKKIFGYVPIGTTCCAGLSMPGIKTAIDKWAAMGAYGVFLDEYGYDYGVTRSKQNEAVSYARSEGLKVFVNAWVPADALGPENERGLREPVLLGSGDYYLMESWIFEHGQQQQPEQWTAKANEALALSMETDVDIAAVATAQNQQMTGSDSAIFQLAKKSASLYGVKAFQWTSGDYSASSNLIIRPNAQKDFRGPYSRLFLSVKGNFNLYTRKLNHLYLSSQE